MDSVFCSDLPLQWTSSPLECRMVGDIWIEQFLSSGSLDAILTQANFGYVLAYRRYHEKQIHLVGINCKWILNAVMWIQPVYKKVDNFLNNEVKILTGLDDLCLCFPFSRILIEQIIQRYTKEQAHNWKKWAPRAVESKSQSLGRNLERRLLGYYSHRENKLTNRDT